MEQVSRLELQLSICNALFLWSSEESSNLSVVLAVHAKFDFLGAEDGAPVFVVVVVVVVFVSITNNESNDIYYM